MKYTISINLMITLLFILESSVLCMESPGTQNSPKVMPCKSQKKPREYDSFVMQCDHLCKKSHITNLNNNKTKEQNGETEKGKKFVWHTNTTNPKKHQPIDECRRKTEGACALLSIRECTCHLNADDKSSLS